MSEAKQEDFSGHTEFIAEAVRGYRSWYLTLSVPASGEPHHYLTPIHIARNKNAWEYTEQKYALATCSNKHRAAQPPDVCRCGFYSWYYPDKNWGEPFNNTDYLVFGVIESGGRIQFGTLGIRSEKARVLAISPFNEPNSQVNYQALAKRYDAKFFKSRKELIKAFPPQDFKNILGEEPKELHAKVEEKREKELQKQLALFRECLYEALEGYAKEIGVSWQRPN